uniref:AB hydrolase-1 domain-containing protein n=1 Tax=Chrysotila carterae TaxID=13221 RepID=A0A7S4FAC2_CHRCT
MPLQVMLLHDALTPTAVLLLSLFLSCNGAEQQEHPWERKTLTVRTRRASARKDGVAYMQVAVSPNVSLSVLASGASQRDASGTVVFLHGFPEGSWLWTDVMGEVEKRRPDLQLLAPDQRGYNSSSKPSGLSDYVVSQLVADVAALVNVFSSGGVHLVAHDWGGAVAWAFAQAHPRLLHSLTIVNMAHPSGWISLIRAGGLQARQSTYVLRFVNPHSTAELTALDHAALRAIFRKEAWFSGGNRDALLRSWSRTGSVDSALNWYRANVQPRCPLSCVTADCWRQGLNTTFDDIFTSRPVVHTPTHVIWGMRDFAFDNLGSLGYIRNNVTFLKGLRISNYSEYGHWIANEAPLLLATTFLEFIQGIYS